MDVLPEQILFPVKPISWNTAKQRRCLIAVGNNKFIVGYLAILIRIYTVDLEVGWITGSMMAPANYQNKFDA